MPFEVTIINTGERFGCRPDQSVLAAMEQLRRKGIPVGCRNGGCGVCKVRVLQGRYSTARMSRAVLSEQEQAQACALACKTFPNSDMQVEVVGGMVRAVVAPRGAAAGGFRFDFEAMQFQPSDNKEK